MELVSLKCESCGGVLSVKSVNDVAFCQFCGNKFIVANSKESIQTVRVDAEIDLLNKAKQLEAFNELSDAMHMYASIIKQYPGNLEALANQLRLCTSNFQCAYLPIYTDESLLINRIKALDGENSSILKPYNEINTALEQYDQERLAFITSNPIEQDDLYGKKNPCKLLDYKLSYDHVLVKAKKQGLLGFIDPELHAKHWLEGVAIAEKVNEGFGKKALKANPSSSFKQGWYNQGVKMFLKKFVTKEVMKELKKELLYNSRGYSDVVYLKDYTLIIRKGDKYNVYPLILKADLESCRKY